MKPVTIAGGGLAGLALGIGLRRSGIPVRVHEASVFPRHRVCGEFISGVTEKTLEALGVRGALEDAESLTSTAWYDRSKQIFTASLPEPARGISRYRLDDRLASQFREVGGEFRENERLSSSRLESEGTVRATGRAVEKESDWLGLKAHVLNFDLEADLEMHLGEEGYIGLSRVEDGRVNVAGLFRRRRDVRAKGAESLRAYTEACGLKRLALRMEAGQLDENSCVGVSSFGFGMKGRNESGGFRIGDQRAIIPPFTGNGMSMALQSSELAMQHLLDFSSDQIPWEECCSRYARESDARFSNRLRAARWVHPFIFSRFGQQVAASLAKGGLLPFSLLYRAVR